jgi:hypothetical protein
MNMQKVTKEERKLALLTQIFETVLKDPNDTVPALSERHQKLFEEKEVIVAPSEAEALEGLKLFLEYKLDKKFYRKPYSSEYGGNAEDVPTDEGSGRYTVNGSADFVYEYKGWSYSANDVEFSRTYYFKEASFKGSYEQPPDSDDYSLESAEWTDNILYLTPKPLDKSKEGNIDSYELTREALGPIGALISDYFAAE